MKGTINIYDNRKAEKLGYQLMVKEPLKFYPSRYILDYELSDIFEDGSDSPNEILIGLNQYLWSTKGDLLIC